jgi:hypothetical protein
MKNSASQMSLDQFTKIVEKLYREGHRQIGLYNWTEPFLNPNLDKYIKVVKSFDLYCHLSSHFSLRRIPHLEAVLLSGLDYFSVTVSGFDQEIYQINHVSGNIAYVKDNLRRAAAIKASSGIHTQIAIRLLKFPYNEDQEPKMAAFAKELGFEFEVPEGRGDPLGHNPVLTNEIVAQHMASYNSERPFEEDGKVCPLIFGAGAVINSRGVAHLCCAYPDFPALAIGSYLDLPQEEILLRRYNHPICAGCTLPRRDATWADKQALLEAMQYRLRMQAVPSAPEVLAEPPMVRAAPSVPEVFAERPMVGAAPTAPEALAKPPMVRAFRLLFRRRAASLRRQLYPASWLTGWHQKLIADSGLFDHDFYLAQCPQLGVDPVYHYLRYGAAEGRDPNPLFDSDWYLQRNNDVRAERVNPLVHYIVNGAPEGRDPSPLFDTDWYLAQYPDVRADGCNPLFHYLRFGTAEGRDPSPLFDTDWYLAQYPDVRADGRNPLLHYLSSGAAEGRAPRPPGPEMGMRRFA